MIRRALMSDLPAIISLAVESVSRDPLPVTVDKVSMSEMGTQMIGHPSHFVWVGETGGVVTSCVAACVQPAFWFRGTQCSVILFYARQTGDGVALIRQLAAWIKSRPSIKLAIFELEPAADPRIERLLERLGFGRKSSNMSYVRGAA